MSSSGIILSSSAKVVKHFNKEETLAIDEIFPLVLHKIIFSYLDVDAPDTHRVNLSYDKPAFLLYLSKLFPKVIAHNLLWHLHMEETLAWAKENTSCLSEVVRLRCPHGQGIEATPLQVLIAAGDRNPVPYKKKEKNYGLAEDLKDCLDPTEAKRQSDQWCNHPDFENETKKTMARYHQALEDFCQELINCNDIPAKPTRDEFKKLLDELPCAIKFRERLKPEPDYWVKRTGLLFDMKILEVVNAIWTKRIIELGGWGRTKSNLFGTIVETALEGRCQRADVGIFGQSGGIVRRAAVSDGLLSKRLDYTDGIPESLQFRRPGALKFGEGIRFTFFGMRIYWDQTLDANMPNEHQHPFMWMSFLQDEESQATFDRFNKQKRQPL